MVFDHLRSSDLLLSLFRFHCLFFLLFLFNLFLLVFLVFASLASRVAPSRTIRLIRIPFVLQGLLEHGPELGIGGLLSTEKTHGLRIVLFHLVGFHLSPVGPDSNALKPKAMSFL